MFLSSYLFPGEPAQLNGRPGGGRHAPPLIEPIGDVHAATLATPVGR